MGNHALLSASSSHRWLHCSPSARLEEQFENTSSVFAEEGTFMHELSELQLRLYLNLISISEFNKQFEAMKGNNFYSDEIFEATKVYVDYVIENIELTKSTTKDAITLIEQRVDFSKWVEGGFGTADTIIVADEVLQVIDLKGGKGVAVSADDNPQMKLYALGALNLFDTLYDIKTVRMTIVQPRLESISTYEVSAEELTQWAETKLKPKAQLAIKGEGEFCSGDHCRFCRARQTCRARANEHLALAKYDFKLPALLSDDEIAGILTVADRLSIWASDVYSYATDLAINENKEWTGFKLVEGRSNRRFADETAVAKICTDNGYTEIYKQSLKGITDMEKYLTKKKFNEILGSLVIKPQGKITLVPNDDKRQSITNTAEADFKGEI